MAAGFRFGDLRHSCLIERKSVTHDTTYGTEIISWVPVATTWCSIEDVAPSRSEAVKNGIASAAIQTIVRIRFRTDVDSSMRMTINRPTLTVYQIIAGPSEIGNRQGLEFMVEKYSS